MDLLPANTVSSFRKPTLFSLTAGSCSGLPVFNLAFSEQTDDMLSLRCLVCGCTQSLEPKGERRKDKVAKKRKGKSIKELRRQDPSAGVHGCPHVCRQMCHMALQFTWPTVDTPKDWCLVLSMHSTNYYL